MTPWQQAIFHHVLISVTSRSLWKILHSLLKKNPNLLYSSCRIFYLRTVIGEYLSLWVPALKMKSFENFSIDYICCWHWLHMGGSVPMYSGWWVVLHLQGAILPHNLLIFVPFRGVFFFHRRLSVLLCWYYICWVLLYLQLYFMCHYFLVPSRFWQFILPYKKMGWVCHITCWRFINTIPLSVALF